MSEATIIGTTTISDRWRMSLLKDVRAAFEDIGDDPEIGDVVVFKRRDDEILVEMA